MLNDPTLRGQLATRKVTFGPLRRYAIAAIHTRLDAVTWFVWDAEMVDAHGETPAIIRQEPTASDALRGLPVSPDEVREIGRLALAAA